MNFLTEYDHKENHRKWANQFFFVTNDEESAIVYGEKAAAMRYEGGKWSSRAPGGQSEEECRQKCDIQADPCKKCGRIYSARMEAGTRAEMLAHGICFSCNFWRGYVERKDDPKIARIGGQHYVVNPWKGGDTRWNGFGGRVSEIEFNDGRTVKTNDLWTQGSIPATWRDRLPDNAKFIPPAANGERSQVIP